MKKDDLNHFFIGYFAFMLLVGLCIVVITYGLAMISESRSVWLMCDMLGLCNG